MEDMQLFLNILEIVASVIIAIITYKISKKQTEIQENQMKFQKQQNDLQEKIYLQSSKPYLYLLKNEFIKDKWERFNKGVPLGNNHIPVTEYKNLDDEQKFYLDEATKYDNNVYFTKYKGSDVFMISHTEGSQQIFIEHHNMKITLRNYGSLVTKLHINSVKFILNNRDVLYFKDVKNNFYTKAILPNEEVEIMLSEATNNIMHSSCNISQESYDDIEDFEQFSKEVHVSLNYNKMIINLSAWNQHNEKFDFDINIWKEGNFMQRDTQCI